MENTQNIIGLTKDITVKLFDSMALLETLQVLIDGEFREDTLISLINKNIKSALEENEQCRKLLGDFD